MNSKALLALNVLVSLVSIAIMVVLIFGDGFGGQPVYGWNGEEGFSKFIPRMPCPATPTQILSRVNGLYPSRQPTGNRGLFACSGDNAALLPGNCSSCKQ